jgi:hypothetical protein
MEHSFTERITSVLTKDYGDVGGQIFANSPILQYLNIKTRSANRGSKSRSSFGNLYAIYVVVEDYVKKGFHRKNGYKDYEGAKFTEIFRRQRELPFGEKLQNHALNHRLNEEFRKYFPTCDYVPILRDVQTNRYWFNENLLNVTDGPKTYNISESILGIIDEYVVVKRGAFRSFIESCQRLKELHKAEEPEAIELITTLLAPNADARLFEIVSYGILKYYYGDQTVYFGFDIDDLQEENLRLYKTGRTNANDGGIDFVMKPLGRFFQVTESIDFRKYFLDIDKIEKFPITFVIKSEDDVNALKERIRRSANEQYSVAVVVERYMSCVEEIINLPTLIERFKESVRKGYLPAIMDEIIRQSKVEFNYDSSD